MAVQYIGDGNSDGTCVGRTSSEPLAFFGATPAARTAFSNAAVATTVAVSSVSTSTWAFSTSTQANAIVALVNEIRAALVTLGLKA